jgi:hypothetical protein
MKLDIKSLRYNYSRKSIAQKKKLLSLFCASLNEAQENENIFKNGTHKSYLGSLSLFSSPLFPFFIRQQQQRVYIIRYIIFAKTKRGLTLFGVLFDIHHFAYTFWPTMIFAYTFSLLIAMSSMCDFIYTTISLTLLAYHLEVFFFAYFSFLVPGNIVLYSVRVAILTLLAYHLEVFFFRVLLVPCPSQYCSLLCPCRNER